MLSNTSLILSSVDWLSRFKRVVEPQYPNCRVPSYFFELLVIHHWETQLKKKAGFKLLPALKGVFKTLTQPEVILVTGRQGERPQRHFGPPNTRLAVLRYPHATLAEIVRDGAACRDSRANASRAFRLGAPGGTVPFTPSPQTPRTRPMQAFLVRYIERVDFEGKLHSHIKDRLKVTIASVKKRVTKLTGAENTGGVEQAFGFAGQEYANGIQVSGNRRSRRPGSDRCQCYSVSI